MEQGSGLVIDWLALVEDPADRSIAMMDAVFQRVGHAAIDRILRRPLHSCAIVGVYGTGEERRALREAFASGVAPDLFHRVADEDVRPVVVEAHAVDCARDIGDERAVTPLPLLLLGARGRKSQLRLLLRGDVRRRAAIAAETAIAIVERLARY